MAIRMTATNVKMISEGVWIFEMPPHQVRHFGGSSISVGARSVMVFLNYEFNLESNELHFNVDDVLSINIGTEPILIGLAATLNTENKILAVKEKPFENERLFGPGDKEYLKIANSEMSFAMQKTALALLNGVRAKSPGDMKRGKSRNFSNTPDNFWYVIFQPRIDQLSITVRGSVEHFKPIAKLPIKDDRGNTLFKIVREDDVPAALEIIFHAKRKMR